MGLGLELQTVGLDAVWYGTGRDRLQVAGLGGRAGVHHPEIAYGYGSVIVMRKYNTWTWRRATAKKREAKGLSILSY